MNPSTDTKRPFLQPTLCPECGIEFTPKDVRRAFCSNAHTQAWHNRNLKRAKSLMTLMQAWRQGRHKKGDPAARYAFVELCAAIDRATEEDRIAGRPPALETLRRRYRRQGMAAGSI